MRIVCREENGELPESDEGSCGPMISHLATIFLICFIPRIVRFAFDAPVFAADSQNRFCIFREGFIKGERSDSIRDIIGTFRHVVFWFDDSTDGKDLSGRRKSDLLWDYREAPYLVSFNPVPVIGRGLKLAWALQQRSQQLFGFGPNRWLIVLQPPEIVPPFSHTIVRANSCWVFMASPVITAP